MANTLDTGTPRPVHMEAIFSPSAGGRDTPPLAGNEPREAPSRPYPPANRRGVHLLTVRVAAVSSSICRCSRQISLWTMSRVCQYLPVNHKGVCLLLNHMDAVSFSPAGDRDTPPLGNEQGEKNHCPVRASWQTPCALWPDHTEATTNTPADARNTSPRAIRTITPSSQMHASRTPKPHHPSRKSADRSREGWEQCMACDQLAGGDNTSRLSPAALVTSNRCYQGTPCQATGNAQRQTGRCKEITGDSSPLAQKGDGVA